jgi:hypothetical protein
VYVFVVEPFTSVTTIKIVFEPWFKANDPDVVPEFIALESPAEFTFVLYVAFDFTAVGVAVIDETVCATVAVYEVVADANTGASVPDEIESEVKFASATVKVTGVDAT